MKRTNTNEFRRACYAYLIACIQDDGTEAMTAAQKVVYIDHRVRRELSHVVDRQGFTQACRDFLAGLGIAIDYMNSDTVAAAGRMHGEDPATWTAKQRDTVEQGWFEFMGYQLAEMCKRVVIEEKRDLLPA